MPVSFPAKRSNNTPETTQQRAARAAEAAIIVGRRCSWWVPTQPPENTGGTLRSDPPQQHSTTAIKPPANPVAVAPITDDFPLRLELFRAAAASCVLPSCREGTESYLLLLAQQARGAAMADSKYFATTKKGARRAGQGRQQDTCSRFYTDGDLAAPEEFLHPAQDLCCAVNHCRRDP